MVEGGKTPFLSAQELEELGYKFIAFSVSALFAAAGAIEECFNHIKKYGTTAGYNNEISFKDFEKIVDVPKFKELEKKFSVKKQRFKKVILPKKQPCSKLQGIST
jgi:methylisocitrate lyase